MSMQLPRLFLVFWFLEAPKEIFAFFLSLNLAFLRLLSFPLFLRTFFKPLKNEYRKGLVGFSIGMGIFVKSILIAVDLFLLSLLAAFEIVILVTFVLLPIISVIILFV